MSVFTKHVVTTLNEYIDVIDEINTSHEYHEGLWFRGQANGSYGLIPSGLRDLKAVIDARGFTIKDGTPPRISSGETMAGLKLDNMLIELKRKGINLIDFTPKNDFEWMFIAQHYGIPTRLLDWATNPLIALFFATKKSINNTKDKKEEIMDFQENEYSNDGCSVFVINPMQINKEFGDDYKIIDVIDEYEDWKHYLKPLSNPVESYGPICIKGYNIDRRIESQSGNFTLHGANIKPIEYYSVIEKKIHKIFIPNSCINDIRKQLGIIGVNNYFVFPDLDGLCKDIYEKEKEIYQLAKKFDKLPKGHE